MTEFLLWTIPCFISTSGVAYLYYKLSDAKIKNWLLVIIVFALGVLFLSTIKYFDITLISPISYFLYFPFLFYVIKFSSLAKYLFYLVMIWIYGVFLDLISMIIVVFLQYILDFDIYGYTSRLALSGIVFILFIFMARSKIVKNFTYNLYKKVQKINYFDFALISFAIFVLLVGLAIFFNLNKLDMSVLLMILILLIGFSFTLLIRVRINLVENNIFLKLLKENNEFYLKIEDENRIFKHNLMAKLLSIKSVSGDKARKLIDDFLKSFNNNMDFSVHIKDMPYGLNGIIYEKIYPYIGKIHIKIDNKIDFDIFKKLKPRRYNVFVEKMIIALDNAVESCMTTTDKILIINLYFEDNNIIMDIKNTFSADLNVEDLGKINYSTKGKRHGLGLFSALRDNEVNISMKIVNSLFITKIVAKQNMEEE